MPSIASISVQQTGTDAITVSAIVNNQLQVKTVSLASYQTWLAANPVATLQDATNWLVQQIQAWSGGVSLGFSVYIKVRDLSPTLAVAICNPGVSPPVGPVPDPIPWTLALAA